MTTAQQVTQLIGEGTSLMLFLVALYFYATSLIGLMTVMVGVSLGEPGALARFVRANVMALFALLLAVLAPDLTGALIQWGQKQDAPTSLGDFGKLMAVPNSALRAVVVIAVLLFFLLMALIMLQTSAGVVAGNPRAISEGVWAAMQLVLVLVIGFAFIQAGLAVYHAHFHP